MSACFAGLVLNIDKKAPNNVSLYVGYSHPMRYFNMGFNFRLIVCYSVGTSFLCFLVSQF